MSLESSWTKTATLSIIHLQKNNATIHRSCQKRSTLCEVLLIQAQNDSSWFEECAAVLSCNFCLKKKKKKKILISQLLLVVSINWLACARPRNLLDCAFNYQIVSLVYLGTIHKTHRMIFFKLWPHYFKPLYWDFAVFEIIRILCLSVVRWTL